MLLRSCHLMQLWILLCIFLYLNWCFMFCIMCIAVLRMELHVKFCSCFGLRTVRNFYGSRLTLVVGQWCDWTARKEKSRGRRGRLNGKGKRGRREIDPREIHLINRRERKIDGHCWGGEKKWSLNDSIRRIEESFIDRVMHVRRDFGGEGDAAAERPRKNRMGRRGRTYRSAEDGSVAPATSGPRRNPISPGNGHGHSIKYGRLSKPGNFESRSYLRRLRSDHPRPRAALLPKTPVNPVWTSWDRSQLLA